MDLTHLVENVKEVVEGVEDTASTVEHNIDELFDAMKDALEARREEVRKLLLDTKNGKLKGLKQQSTVMQELQLSLEETTRMGKESLTNLHLEEFNSLIDPLMHRLEGLSDRHESDVVREPSQDKEMIFKGGTEAVITSMLKSFGSIHTTTDAVEGLEKEKEEVTAGVGRGGGGGGGGGGVGRIHLTVKAMPPRDGTNSLGEAGAAGSASKDTVCIEIREGSEWDCVKKGGIKGEILGRVVVVNTIEKPPRDSYGVSQFIESLFTHVDDDEKQTIRHADEGVPTTRFTKLIKFGGEGQLAKKLREEAEDAKDYEWRETMAAQERG